MHSSPVLSPQDTAISCTLLGSPPSRAAYGICVTSEPASEEQLCIFQHPSTSLTITLPSLVEKAFSLLAQSTSSSAAGSSCQQPKTLFSAIGFWHFKSLFFLNVPKTAKELKAGPWWAVGWEREKFKSLKVVHYQKNLSLTTEAMLGVHSSEHTHQARKDGQRLDTVSLHERVLSL